MGALLSNVELLKNYWRVINIPMSFSKEVLLRNVYSERKSITIIYYLICTCAGAALRSDTADLDHTVPSTSTSCQSVKHLYYFEGIFYRQSYALRMEKLFLNFCIGSSFLLRFCQMSKWQWSEWSVILIKNPGTISNSVPDVWNRRYVTQIVLATTKTWVHCSFLPVVKEACIARRGSYHFWWDNRNRRIWDRAQR